MALSSVARNKLNAIVSSLFDIRGMVDTRLSLATAVAQDGSMPPAVQTAATNAATALTNAEADLDAAISALVALYQ